MQRDQLADQVDDAGIAGQAVQQDPAGGAHVPGRGPLPGRHTQTVRQNSYGRFLIATAAGQGRTRAPHASGGCAGCRGFSDRDTALGFIGSNPWAIAITPDGKTAYVVNNGSGTVTPIRTATNTALKAIKVGIGPFAIAITPDGKTAYVTNRHSGTVTPIRTATNTALKAINVGSGPFAVAITP